LYSRIYRVYLRRRYFIFMNALNLTKIRKYVLYLYIFSLPWQGVWLLREPILHGEKWQYGTIGLYGSDAVLLILILLSLPLLKNIRNKVDGVMISFIVVVVWAGLSVFWADDQVLAVYFACKLFLAGCVFHMARYMSVDMRSIVSVFFLSAVFQSVLGIWQFLSQSSFSSVLLGLSEYESWKPGVSVLKNETGRWLRAYGGFPHPNMLGGYLAISLVMIIAWMPTFMQRKEKQSLLTKSVFVTGIALIFLGLLCTFSRIAWGAFFLGIIGFVVYNQNYVRTKRKEIVRVLSLVGVIGGICVGIFFSNILFRFDMETIQEEGSVSERIFQVQQAIHMFQHTPWAGVGAGNYTKMLLAQDLTIPVWTHQPVHNIFLLISVELGVIGGLLFVVSVAMILFIGLKKNRADSRINIFFPMVCIFTPITFFDHWLWTSHFGIFFLALVGGIALREVTIIKKNI